MVVHEHLGETGLMVQGTMCRTPIGGGTSAALGLPHPAGLAFCITLLHAGTVRRRRGPGGAFFCRSSELGDVGAATSAEVAGDPFPMVASEAHCAPEVRILPLSFSIFFLNAHDARAIAAGTSAAAARPWGAV